MSVRGDIYDFFAALVAALAADDPLKKMQINLWRDVRFETDFGLTLHRRKFSVGFDGESDADLGRIELIVYSRSAATSKQELAAHVVSQRAAFDKIDAVTKWVAREVEADPSLGNKFCNAVLEGNWLEGDDARDAQGYPTASISLKYEVQ